MLFDGWVLARGMRLEIRPWKMSVVLLLLIVLIVVRVSDCVCRLLLCPALTPAAGAPHLLSADLNPKVIRLYPSSLRQPAPAQHSHRGILSGKYDIQFQHLCNQNKILSSPSQSPSKEEKKEGFGLGPPNNNTTTTPISFNCALFCRNDISLRTKK